MKTDGIFPSKHTLATHLRYLVLVDQFELNCQIILFISRFFV